MIDNFYFPMSKKNKFLVTSAPFLFKEFARRRRKKKLEIEQIFFQETLGDSPPQAEKNTKFWLNFD